MAGEEGGGGPAPPVPRWETREDEGGNRPLPAFQKFSPPSKKKKKKKKKERKINFNPRLVIRFRPPFSPDEFIIIETTTMTTLQRYLHFRMSEDFVLLVPSSLLRRKKKRKKVERVLRSCPVLGISTHRHTHIRIQTHLKALPRYTSGECNKLQVSQPTQMKFVSRGGKELRSRGWPE